jgi:hypothetical protein
MRGADIIPHNKGSGSRGYRNTGFRKVRVSARSTHAGKTVGPGFPGGLRGDSSRDPAGALGADTRRAYRRSADTGSFGRS